MRDHVSHPYKTTGRGLDLCTLIFTFAASTLQYTDDRLRSKVKYYRLNNTGLFEMTVGVLTTYHTQYTWDRSIYIFYLIKFNRAPVRYVTKTWSVVLLNKETHILLSQVYCVWKIVKTQSFRITLYFYLIALQRFIQDILHIFRWITLRLIA